MRRVRLTRDTVLLAAGLSILAHQVLVAAEVEPALVAAAMGLILTPAVSKVDDAARDRREVSDREAG